MVGSVLVFLGNHDRFIHEPCILKRVYGFQLMKSCNLVGNEIAYQGVDVSVFFNCESRGVVLS